jgi:hypothetical protein
MIPKMSQTRISKMSQTRIQKLDGPRQYVEGHSAENSKALLRFDYTTVSPKVAKFLQGQAERVSRQYSTSVVQIGKALIGVRHYLPHGAFVRWVESEAHIPSRTAQVYMKVAKWISGKTAAVAELPPSVLYLLSAPSTPQDFVQDVLSRVDAGEQILSAAIRKEIMALRTTEREGWGKRLPAPSTSAEHVGRPKIDVISSDTKTIVAQAVTIVARGLPPEDFKLVRDMMTSKRVLDDPQLAESIAMAFSNVDTLSAKGCTIGGALALRPPHEAGEQRFERGDDRHRPLVALAAGKRSAR